MKKVRLEYQLIHKDAIVPSKTRVSDAGFDVATIEGGVIPPHGYAVFPTGIKVACPLGYFISIRGRSGLAFKYNVIPFIGTLDSGYVGGLYIKLFNFNDTPYFIDKGDRIAQIIIEEQFEADYVEVEEFSPEYCVRGEDGFGSTGK